MKKNAEEKEKIGSHYKFLALIANVSKLYNKLVFIGPCSKRMKPCSITLYLLTVLTF